MQRIVIFGNSGSGKTTMARRLADEHAIAHLDLDSLAWSSPGVRRDLSMSTRDTRSFLNAHGDWIVEGCYADLLEQVVPFATELRFLNPGAEACVSNCRKRPWEPDKYASQAEQDKMLDFLIGWVREYETRNDEYSLTRHRQLFDGFEGPKTEYVSLPGSHDKPQIIR